jgi:hypothetical protein
MAASAPLAKPRPRTVFYIDGLNLYYGAVRQTPAFKWLDIARYCKLLRPHDDIILIRYFSALITGPTRVNQEVYLRALATTPLVEVTLGRFKISFKVESKIHSFPRLGGLHHRYAVAA